MIGLLVLLFPVLLLGFLLFMQRVEEPLNRSDPAGEIEQMLDERDPGDMDTLVRQGTASALRRFRLRRRRRRRHRG